MTKKNSRKVQVIAMVREDLKRRLQEEANRRDISLSQLCREIIQHYDKDCKIP